MSELVPSEIIERLEQRHEKLIGELDALNARLEQTLNGFSRPAEQEPAVQQSNEDSESALAGPTKTSQHERVSS